jgi:hypothetical protein
MNGRKLLLWCNKNEKQSALGGGCVDELEYGRNRLWRRARGGERFGKRATYRPTRLPLLVPTPRPTLRTRLRTHRRCIGEAMPMNWNLAGLAHAAPAAATSSDDAHPSKAVFEEPHPPRLAGWAASAVDPGMVGSSGAMTGVPIARSLSRSMTMRPAVDRVPQTSR